MATELIVIGQRQDERAGQSGGGCACCSDTGHASAAEDTDARDVGDTGKGAQASVATYTVTGMTCGHCVASVTDEISVIDGVTAVDVDLASGLVTVTSLERLSRAAVESAVDEAGYRLLG